MTKSRSHDCRNPNNQLIHSFAGLCLLLFVTIPALAEPGPPNGPAAPDIFGPQDNQNIQRLLEVPDVISRQLEKMEFPIRFLEREAKIPIGQLSQEFARQLQASFNKPFENLAFVTPGGERQIQQNYAELFVQTAEAFLKKYETHLQEYNTKGFLRDLRKTPKQVLKSERSFLRAFLRERGIRISGGNAALDRVLNHFRSNYKGQNFLIYTQQLEALTSGYTPEQLREAVRDWNRKFLNEWNRIFQGRQRAIPNDVVQRTTTEFSDFINEKYTEKLTGKEAKAAELFQKILDARGIGPNEVRNFRQILEYLRVPAEFHHNEFIRTTLHGWQVEYLQRAVALGQIELTPKKAKVFFERIRTVFHDWHYDILKDQSRAGAFVRALPLNLGLFQLAAGGTLFFENFAWDHFAYDSYKNPLFFESLAAGALNIPANASLTVFMYAALQMQKHLHAYANHIPSSPVSNFMKTRLSGPLSMIFAYILSEGIREAMTDTELHECVAFWTRTALYHSSRIQLGVGSLIQLNTNHENGFYDWAKDSHNNRNQRTTSCEAVAIKWSEKKEDIWYDGLGLLGAAWASTRTLRGFTNTVHKLAGGTYKNPKVAKILAKPWVARTLTQTSSWMGVLTRPTGIVISLGYFLVWNMALEHLVIKEFKESNFIARIKENANALISQLTGGDLFNHVRKIQDNEVEVARLKQIDLQGNQGRIDELEEQIQVSKDYLDEYIYPEMIKRAKRTDYQFRKWDEVKSRDYQQSMELWKLQTNKTLSSFTATKSLLEEMYKQAHIDELGPVNKYFYEMTEGLVKSLEDLHREHGDYPMNLQRATQVCRQSGVMRILKSLKKTDDELGTTRELTYKGKVRSICESHLGAFVANRDNALNFQEVSFEKLVAITRYDNLDFQIAKVQSPEFAAAAKHICHPHHEAILRGTMAFASLCQGLKEKPPEINIPQNQWEDFFKELKDLPGRILYDSPGFENMDQIPIENALDYVSFEPSGLFAADKIKTLAGLPSVKKLALARQLLNPLLLDPDFNLALLLDDRIREQWTDRVCETKYQLWLGWKTDCLEREKIGPGAATSAETLPTALTDHVNELLQERIRAAGLYLLREALLDRNYTFRSLKPPEYALLAYPDATWNRVLFTLTEMLGVAGKGERFFKAPSEMAEMEEEEDPEEQQALSLEAVHTRIFKALACGQEEAKIGQDFFFTPPRMLESFKPLCRDLTETRPTLTRDRLFNRPLVFKGEPYENAYLAFESLLRRDFETKGRLMWEFQHKTAEIAEEAQKGLLKDFFNIVDNYLIPNLTNKEPSGDFDCDQLEHRYNLEHARDFKGLEIPIAQINHEISQLKLLKNLSSRTIPSWNIETTTDAMLQKLEEGKNENSEGQDRIHCEVLNLLKGYHDIYAEEKTERPEGREFFFPEQSLLLELTLREQRRSVKGNLKGAKDSLLKPELGVSPDKKALGGPSLITEIQKAMLSPAYIDKDLVFYAILKEFFPEYNDPLFVLEEKLLKPSSDKCEFSQRALFPVFDGLGQEAKGKINTNPPHRGLTFPAVLAPIKENCPVFFEDEKERLIYTTLVSLYRGLERYYRTLKFLAQARKINDELFPEFEAVGR